MVAMADKDAFFSPPPVKREKVDAGPQQERAEKAFIAAFAAAAAARVAVVAAAAEARVAVVAAAADARAAEAVAESERRARIELVAAVAAARAIATAVAVVSSLARAARVPVEEAAQEQLDPKDCLSRPGIYVYHVGCLTVTFIDTTSGQKYSRKWCVVKVGKAEEGKISRCINDRLRSECEDIRRWKGSPEAPRITAADLSDENVVGDIVACFHGSNFTAWEGKIREYLGLPLGAGRIVARQEDVLNQMQARGPDGAFQDCGRYQNAGDKKIRALGWKMYLYKSDRDLDDGWNIGPSELIMMPKRAMKKLRKKFKEEPAKFASKYNTYDDEDGGKGPAWDYIQEAREALPPDWHKKEVTVRFTTDGLIDPLTLKLWDPSKEVK